MFWIICIVIAVFAVIIYLRSYKLDIYRTITAYTGGVGSGKTFLSVRQSILCYKRALKAWKRRTWLKRLFRKPCEPKPLLFSNIPIHYSPRLRRKKRSFVSCVLTPEIVLLQVKIPEGSVVLVDEVSGFLNQFEYAKNDNVRLFDEFCRFVRQYVGGSCIINDQCSANVVLQIRRRLNTIYNLSKHRFILGLTWVNVREINISDEIIAIDQKDTNEPYKRFFCVGNYFKYYKSRCYRNRYQVLPECEPTYHDDLYTNELFICPNKLFPNMIEKLLHDEASSEVSATPKVGGNLDAEEILIYMSGVDDDE